MIPSVTEREIEKHQASNGNKSLLVVDALKTHGVLHTYELREMGLPNPHVYVHAARRKGYKIVTEKKATGGYETPIAHYSLIS